MSVKKSVGWPEIDELINECEEKAENMFTDYPERTYEEGVIAGIRWVTGQASEHPLDKEK